MKLPDMKYVKRNKMVSQIRFGGLNHTQGARDGEIWDMRNMSTDHYPVMASRMPRWHIRKLERPGGLVALDKLGWVEGTGFYYDGIRRGDVTEGKKRFGVMGKRILIFPDKLVYDTESGELTKMESRWKGRDVFFENGLSYGESAKANTIRCEGVNWADWFREGDAVTISGCTTEPKNNKSPIIREIDGDKMYFYEHTFTMKSDEPVEESGEISIERTVPDLLAVSENENRMWGTDGKTVYASKPGDLYNWNVYDGIESDSWTVTPESTGDFAGCYTYKGFPQFFKPEQICKVYGSYPSNFQLLSSATMGVEMGSGDSLAVAGETLFWLGLNGVVAYSGGIPQLISKKLGEKKFRNAVAGSNGVKYYISMEDEDGQWRMYVFDTRCSQWCVEDETHVIQFARIGMDLYWLTEDGEIWLNGDAANVPEEAELEQDVRYSVEFAEFLDKTVYKRSLKRIHIRATEGYTVYIRRDGHTWEDRQDTNFPYSNTEKDLMSMPVRNSNIMRVSIGAVDRYAIRIEGTMPCSRYRKAEDNQAKIWEMTREYYEQKSIKNYKG